MTGLLLGTAQFGSAYGVTNTIGRLHDDDVMDILELARLRGIQTFDTAADYGDSQERLGRLAPAGSQYVTKFSLPESGELDADALWDRSRRTLAVDTLAGVMFHRIADLTDPRCEDALALLREARAAGTIERAGVSIYDESDLRLALDVFPDLDIVQLPANALDTRLIDSDIVNVLHDSGVRIHVRSAYLQGVLLADSTSLAPNFAPLRPVVEHLSDLAQASQISVAALLLGFLRDHPVVDEVVVGAVRVSELASTADAWSATVPPVDLREFSVPKELLDPRTWRRE